MSENNGTLQHSSCSRLKKTADRSDESQAIVGQQHLKITRCSDLFMFLFRVTIRRLNGGNDTILGQFERWTDGRLDVCLDEWMDIYRCIDDG